MSENYISRLFKAETGMNLIYYINLMKMERAKNMLYETDCTIREIALATGFGEQSYFNRTFSKMYGIAPSEYRLLISSLC